MTILPLTILPPVSQDSQQDRQSPVDPVLTVSLLNSFADAASLRDPWDKLVLELQGELYSSFDWCRIWWSHYGRGRELRIFVFHTGGELVGVVPMFRERLWSCGGLRIAKLVGCDFAMAICSLLVRPRWGSEAAGKILSYWLNEGGSDAVWFGPLSGSDSSVEHVRQACNDLGPAVQLVRDAVMGVHSAFHPAPSFDEFIEGLDKSQKQNYRRDMNRLVRTFRIESDVIVEEGLALKEFEAFQVMHTAQWVAQGKLGHFRDWPGSLDFNRELVREHAALGRFRLYRLLADGNVVSSQYGFCLGDRLCARLPARPAGREWDRFGLGRVGLIKMIESAITEGVRHIEAGCGHYDYKVLLGAKEYPLGSMLISSNRMGSRLRCRGLALASQGLHLLYYRIWFGRIAPKLPLSRRALWKSWIRSRV
jgi:CelD/BcsL family acetyltransferase involved in cellulose biosynthesis